MAVKQVKVRVYEDEESFTGYSIASKSGAGLPATIWEVALWNMYQSAIAEIVYLKAIIDEQNPEKDTGS